MAQVIIHNQGVFNLYSTIADGPSYESGLTQAQLEEVIEDEYGKSGLAELPSRIARARETGCSQRGWTLKDLIAANRAGKNEQHVPFTEFIAQFLTLPKIPTSA